MKSEVLPGPERAIPFTRDSSGYPAVRARNVLEGTYALGYLHARDRLVQVTLTGLAARGELMSVLGDVPVARLVDHNCRAMGLVRDSSEQVARCSAHSQALLTAYADGFNAGAGERGRPLLLRLLGVKPAPFSAERVLEVFRFVSYFGLTSLTISTELIVAELAARGAPRRVFERLLGPNARGLDLEALKTLRIPKEFSYFEGAAASAMHGSNAFAVAAARSATGGALLMGEFHMEIGRSPPILYAAELSFDDGAYLSGITIPGCPWFAAGRTEHVAWSYTFAHADNANFVSEHVRDGQYLRDGEYRPLRRREERVAIKGRAPEVWTFHEHETGTVFGDVSGESDLPCLRVTGVDEAHRAFSAASRLLECRTVDDLLEIQREITSVSLEAILADASGDIASIITGAIDEKPAGYSGAYPLLGRVLSHDAPARVAESERPIALRPPLGVVASANQGGQEPYRWKWCTFPEAPYRFERITELLAARERHDPSSMIAISYDVLDGCARRLMPVWSRFLPDLPLARELVAWATEQRDRSFVSLFGALYEEACFLLLEADLERPMARRFREWSALALHQHQLDALFSLERPELLNEAELGAIVRAAFEVARAKHREFDVPVRMRFANLLTRGKSPAAFGLDSPEIVLPGSNNSPFQCRVSPVSGQRLIYAPAFHLLVDMSRRGAWYNLPGGASESRFGPGYGKGIDAWLNGTLVPLGSAELEVLRKK